MTARKSRRKLAAILSADVKGYSRLMEDDEEATVSTVTAFRKLFSELIILHNGRVVDAKGDNLLAEFPSVVDAVCSAVEVQKQLKARNSDLPENRRMEFRIGINTGDVIEEEDAIYGDGVNIAARLEGLAEGSGICISGKVYDEIRNKLNLEYEYMGEHAVKNISRPVRAYRLGTESETCDLDVSDDSRSQVKPSIAILPFVNMSGDTEQEFFSDGISENIITALSQTPDLFVIARNSSFTYKEKSVMVQQVGRELGVRYVLEGSVRRGGDLMRITVQLIDATTGHHVWAEHYDREIRDIFLVQDEITNKILLELRVRLTEGEQARLYARGTDNIEAYLKILKAQGHFNHFNKESNFLAKRLCEEVIALEPQWEFPYALLGLTHLMDVWYRWSDSPADSVKKAFELAQKALSLNESAIAHAMLGYLYTLSRQHDKAMEEAKKSIELDPNAADAHVFFAINLYYAGESSRSIPLFEKALRLNPFPPSWYFVFLGAANRSMGHYEKAVSSFRNAINLERANLFAHLGLAATWALAGRPEEAGAAAEKALEIDPSFSLEYIGKTIPFKNEADRDVLVEALRKAGLK